MPRGLEPYRFFREFGGNIYFLEEYDPTKIPILFVHGALGSPRGWQYLLEHIDLNRFQPWFYYYPSGASIKSMADLLFWKIFNLQSKYQFKEIYLVAHSMGGLVVRSFLVDYGQQFPSITKFISISTPWSGDNLSEYGVKYSPGVIPAWKDMGPQSDFAQSIYRKKLPAAIDYYLFFGHKGNRNPLRPIMTALLPWPPSWIPAPNRRRKWSADSMRITAASSPARRSQPNSVR